MLCAHCVHPLRQPIARKTNTCSRIVATTIGTKRIFKNRKLMRENSSRATMKDVHSMQQYFISIRCDLFSPFDTLQDARAVPRLTADGERARTHTHWGREIESGEAGKKVNILVKYLFGGDFSPLFGGFLSVFGWVWFSFYEQKILLWHTEFIFLFFSWCASRRAPHQIHT